MNAIYIAAARRGKVDGDFQGPICAFRLLDMRIALGSALKIAGRQNFGRRIMYSAGVAARRTGLAE